MYVYILYIYSTLFSSTNCLLWDFEQWRGFVCTSIYLSVLRSTKWSWCDAVIA